MFMNQQAFRPDTLYEINLNQKRIPVTRSMYGGMLSDSEGGNYDLCSFRDNLEAILAGAENDEFKQAGTHLKLI